MDLNAASYFIQVVQAGSFVQASRTLDIPKSTLSDKISELEAELGVTLLVRTTRKLSLTEAGETFYKKVQPALLQIRSAGEETSDFQSAHQGRLRITTVDGMGSSGLMDHLARFRQKFPAIKVELEFTDRIVDIVGEGFDIAIRSGALEDSTLISKKVGTGSFGLLAGPKYLKQRGIPKHPKELIHHACIQFSTFGVDPVWELQNQSGKKARIEISGDYSANSVAAIKRLAELNEGIALLPLFQCQKEFKQGSLVHVLPEWATALAPVHLVYPKQKFINPRIRAVLPYLEQACREIASI
jgi:DNA-binding transcriptional LysR family regulator